ncbi:unnamed protein product [Spirodela intermedia]|uniref:Uncharacterized protein n=1 Tax=Spirodela intermedia TaxID=51605 RepID=A0A7I8II01_SPIIN|nr:unnamed protein product [Spirodela intermedia]CAA6657128.1 unnamed protein product [Spirodela intermedia]
MLPSPVLVLGLLGLLSPIAAAALTAPSDVAALASVKAAVAASSIPPRSCLATWDFSAADPCATPRRTHFVCGVSCGATDAGGATRVTAVVLEDAGYEGSLSPAVGKLSFLSHLDLSGNSFKGPLPSSLRHLLRLRTLSLSFNAFSGRYHLPSGISELWRRLPAALPPSLVALALRGNALSGPISRATFAGLHRLEVAEMAANRISGLVEGWFLRLPALQQVNLANNSLSGFVVGEAAPPPPQLVALDLGYNRIEGELPAELAGFPVLTSLTLRHNRIKGAIPSQYAGGKTGSPLRRLFLDGNFLNGKVPQGFLGGVAVIGRLGDNCLEGCPDGEDLCQPLQKPPRSAMRCTAR